MTPTADTIVIRGAREHNLRNVNLELPRNALIVFTGVSGSGKSSLAFDTLYAEGQRRYIESLSSYARQFMGQLQKPDVDYLGGLSPSISIQQKAAGRNPRSTVGTITEVFDYLRVLYARIGQGHCPECGRPITAQSREQIVSRVLALPEGTRCLILAPLIRGQKGEYKDLFEDLLKRGFVRARVDGKVVRLTEDLKLDRQIKHFIEVVVDRLRIEARVRTRLAEAIEQALALGEGNVIIAAEAENASVDAGDRQGDGASAWKDREPAPLADLLLSAHYACTRCYKSWPPPSPQLFSFNSPQGMCPACDGLGVRYDFDPELLIPDPTLSFAEGALPLVGRLRGMGRWRRHIFEGVAETLGIDLHTPWRDLPEQHRQWLLYGAGDRHIVYSWRHRGGVWKHGGTWEGVVPPLMSSFKKTPTGPRRLQLEKYVRRIRCPDCQGRRLNRQAAAVRLGGKTLPEICSLTIGELADWFAAPPSPGDHAAGSRLTDLLNPVQLHIAGEVLKEIRARLQFLLNVGLHYLTLDRGAPTLSGGEAQRIRLASQIGSGLVGVLYILDEPSIGLHPHDNERLLASLKRLRDMGNTVLVVEHDEDTMRAADCIVDFGPGPGIRGGQVVAQGTLEDVAACTRSLTGQYLCGQRQIEVPRQRRLPGKHKIRILGARHNNLKNINVEFPLGVFIGVSGVSGSGKSSLVNDILRDGLRGLGAAPADKQAEENGETDQANWGAAASVIPQRCRAIKGADLVDKVLAIDQSPIGRTPRSNPATYIKVFDEIRGLFAQMPQAKLRGYKPARFSFNLPGGRCEACEGNGSNRLEMDFLADVWVTCPVCEGRRFNRETLQVRFKDKNIHDVLEMDVQEALSHFSNVPKIQGMIQTLHDVGLDYMKLGQPSPTLSGGEAQRIKLAKELCRRSTGKTLYILDEPTTGLHFDDIQKLLKVLHGFVDQGNTVVVIEHNLDVLKTADWIIDLGPEGGAGGGWVVAAGTPEEIAAVERSHTGRALRKHLSPGARHAAAGKRKPATILHSRGHGDPESPRLTHIEVRGATQHNLKSINVTVPREAMTVCCGPSGSGKTSLALDTIYAEGQRRYVESLSAYARQFLGQIQKPKVESVTGLSPAISIEQKTASKSPRSTVGTITEVHDYLRILFARLGRPHCPRCRIPIGTQTADEIIDKLLSLPEGTKIHILAPVERKGQEKYEVLWEEIRRTGFVRLRVDGVSYGIDSPPPIDHHRKHQVEVIVDRVVVRPNQRGRIADAVEAALDLGRGVLRVAQVNDKLPEDRWKVDRFSQHLACDRCGRSFEPLNPHHFSFNSPLGWCPTCEGLGVQQGANPAALIRDAKLSIEQGAVAAWPPLVNTTFRRFAEALSKHLGFSLSTPFGELDVPAQRAVLHGTGDDWIALDPETKEGRPGVRFQYKGLFPAIDEATRVSHVYRQRLDYLVSEVPCSACGGSRLRDDAAAVEFFGKTLSDLCAMPLGKTLAFFQHLKLTKPQRQVAGELLREVRSRLQFLVDVGLDYLTLDRTGPTLSGGEAQRIRLASQIGSGLTGVLYVLDEPTIGLHPRDNCRLIKAMNHLRDLGNTLLVVEHDRKVLHTADYLLDFGPGAGDRGGEIVAQGTLTALRRNSASLTGRYLSGKQAIPVPTNRRPFVRQSKTGGPFALVVKGARQHNLQHIDVEFPLSCFIAVTGVSGSGKSTLVNEVLYNTLARKLHRARTPLAAHDDILGISYVDKVINVDQNPIGNSPTSNPATYTGVFDLIRQLFAQLPDAKVRGYHPRRFSFNKPGGRCEACQGNGQKLIEMHFLPDVWVECEVCRGARYNPETLLVRYKGHTIADVLNMRVSHALKLFQNIPKIRRILQTLSDVGLDYLTLGQAAPTLSGGESQRVKLAAELGRPNTGKTLYILDEPTTGLHFDDVRKLLDVLHRLVDLGNTVVVIEHNLDVIKTADWVIDLGPEAGAGGGQVVAAGTPEELVAHAAGRSHTAAFLAEVLSAGPHAERQKYDPHTASQPADGEIDLDVIGAEAKMPWEIDGKRWHTRERLTRNGKPAKWDGTILEWLDAEIHKLGPFGRTSWNHRTQVEIAATTKSLGWFLHASTGEEWVVWLTFRVGRNTFKQEVLTERLGIRTLSETPGLETCGDYRRVRVKSQRGPWQSVEIAAHSLAEIDTPAFREFLREAAASFQHNIRRMKTRPEDLMPWKINGERWHLSEKGFHPGRSVQWDRSLLPTLVEVVKEAAPNVEIIWTNRDAITFRSGPGGCIWGRVKTKDADALSCHFICPSGQFNLARLGTIGWTRNLVQDDTIDRIDFSFRRPEELQPLVLKELLRELLGGLAKTDVTP